MKQRKRTQGWWAGENKRERTHKHMTLVDVEEGSRETQEKKHMHTEAASIPSCIY
jgi:hypothetical protein